MELIAGSACSSLRFVDRKPRAVCSLSSSLYNHNVWPIFDLFLYYVLLPLSSLHSFSSKLTSQKTGNMSNNISAFVDGLSLPSSQAQSLTSKLESDSNLALISTAAHIFNPHWFRTLVTSYKLALELAPWIQHL